jgi:hypothetical protein
MTDEDRERLVRMETKLDTNATSLGILFRSIEGNGQPGLKQRMTVLEAGHDACQRERDSGPSRHNNVIQWVMVLIMVVTAVITVTLG